MTNRVMLIGADASLQRKVRDACRRINAEAHCLNSLEDLSDSSVERPAEVILCDRTTFDQVRHRWPEVSVLLFTEPADSGQAIEAIKLGALDYLVRPIGPSILQRQLREALRIGRAIEIPELPAEGARHAHVERIIGQSPAMTELYKLVGLIAPRDINVLITGESGTGKELVARAVLHHSPRKDKPYLAVNCAAIPETLLESELFGHEKGAFTGAVSRRMGKFEQCDGGTLFLDEVGDIPLPTQAKLLRVLQDGTFQRLGGSELIHADVRILAATHQPLETLIAEGRFRRDLYYRIQVATLEVPPLREREVDVVLLAHHFVRRYNEPMGASVRTFSPEVLPLLLQYSWPGNVRELENAIKSALVVARGTVLLPEFLPEHVRRGSGKPATEGVNATAPADHGEAELSPVGLREWVSQLAEKSSLAGNLHRTAVRMAEREIIRAALQATGGRLATAARLLGISRTTLRKKLAELKVEGVAESRQGISIDH